LAANSRRGDPIAVPNPRRKELTVIPGVEMRLRLGDRLGVAAVTYVLFGVKLGPVLALFVVLMFAIWIGWRWSCRNIQQSPLVFRASRRRRPLTLGSRSRESRRRSPSRRHDG
jgi:hypothetical protein